MTHPTLAAVIDAAHDHLTARQAAGYASDVITGRQRWSGADLRGKAARYGASYAMQRGKALAALRAAGGRVVALRRQHGLRTTAARLCVDDFGVEIYATVAAGVVSAQDLA